MTQESRLEQIVGSNDARSFDLLFIHGLNGDARKSWEVQDGQSSRVHIALPESSSRTDSCFWPDWMANHFPDAGVWSLGYPADSSAWIGTSMPLTDRATNVLQLLHLHKIGDRPLILITHSLGGLLAKQILHTALTHNNPTWERIGRSVRGILFLATPHSGSQLASLMNVFRAIARPNTTIADLRPHAPHLRELNEWFRSNFNSLGLRAHVLRETNKTSGVLVVDETSADPGITGVRVIPLDKDHINICKPRSIEDQVHLEACRFISDCIPQNDGAGDLTMAEHTGSTGAKTIESLRDGSDGKSKIRKSFNHSFENFIDGRRKGFVGRDFLRRKVDEFIGDGRNPSGYLFIRGVPGIGKSAFLATLIREREYGIYHFNRASSEKVAPAAEFLKNICARLIVAYDLQYNDFPDKAFESGEFLEVLLNEASKKLTSEKYIVILVDALDEADRSTLPPRENLLFLPESLPDRVYVIATMRPLTDLPLRVAYSRPHPSEPHLLNAHSPENRQDALEYIESRADDVGIQAWMSQHELTRDAFKELLLEKSEANFMYLHHTLPALAEGWLRELVGKQLPAGLDQYYREHWRHMRSLDPETFDELHKPVICALAALDKPVHLEKLAIYASAVTTPIDMALVRKALDDLWEYLEVGPATKEEAEAAETTEGETVYRLYHNQFRDFLASGEVDYALKKAHGRIIAAIERDWPAVG